MFGDISNCVGKESLIMKEPSYFLGQMDKPIILPLSVGDMILQYREYAVDVLVNGQVILVIDYKGIGEVVEFLAKAEKAMTGKLIDQLCKEVFGGLNPAILTRLDCIEKYLNVHYEHTQNRQPAGIVLKPNGDKEQ